MLSLYSLHYWTSEDDCLYADYRREDFGGAQGIYYPAEVRQGFAKYLRLHGVIGNKDHYDYLLRDYLLQEDIPLFACTPSLVQHMGKKTTGLGVWHESLNFVENVSAEAIKEMQEAP